jgi:hypothetical protein
MTTTPVLNLPMENVKVNGKHDYETGVDADEHQFVIVDATSYRDEHGKSRQHFSHRWAVFVCNDPDCPAEVLVPTSVFEDAVNAAVTVSVG